ncbi:MAG: 50S ribosomal protein L11 [Candidatus Pacearchaeota archaeon]|jgi:large subunit ribosomal protein L11
MQIKILAEGGAMKPGPALSQKLGPLGININSVISKVNEATKDFDGMKVPIELDVDAGTKSFEVKVFSPPVSELLKKELKIDKGSSTQKNIKVANASIEQIIKVAKTKSQNLLCNDLKTATKTVAGSCVSLGILIENKLPQEIEREIEKGIYDKEINKEITEASEEKKKSLKDFFEKVKAEQDKKLKAAQAAKEAEQAKEPEKKEVAKPVTTPVKKEEKAPAKKSK